MRKASTVVLVLAVSAALAGTALAGGGSGVYDWSVSFSNARADSNLSPTLVGPTPIYLWYTGCNGVPAGAGMSAAEFDAVFEGGWSQFGFTPDPVNGFLNAGGPTNLLLAVGGCPTGPMIVGQWTVFGTSGRMRLAKAALSGEASTVDCETTPPGQWFWPEQMRFVGAATDDQATSLQDWGNGCGTDPVSPSSWGSVKSLYR